MDYGTYVSCIKIGKQPIIPPLLSEECRNEMRYYRDLAVSLEKRRKCRRNSADSGVMISSNDGSCQKKSEEIVHKPLSIADTSKDLVSADGSSSNEVMVSAEGSSSDSDHDNVFFEAEKTCSPLRDRRNSYTIEQNPSNEQTAKSENSPKTTLAASTTSTSSDEHQNSTAASPTASQSSTLPCESSTLPCESQNSSDAAFAPENSVPRERRNSYTINAAVVTPAVVKERRNSYTLDNPSPVMLQYMQSLEHCDRNKQCELFIESLQVPLSTSQLANGIEEKELSLEDLVSDSTESEDLKLSEFGMWDACSDETLHNFLKADLQSVDSLPSSVCGSPISVIPAGNLECLKSSSEVLDTKASPTVINRSCECICNAVSNLESLKSEADPILRKNCFDDRVDDSFSRDFRSLDLSNISDDSDCLEGRYSECSSVSLSKFLAGDRLPDGAEAEYVAFNYMKEQLEQKHRNEFKRLLQEQQREHDNLKAQFTKVSSLSKNTPSPKSNYAYSGSVLLKKYTPTSGQSTPLTSKSVDEQRTNGTCGRLSRSGSLSAVEVKNKTVTRNGKLPRPKMTVEQAASKINAAVRGYLTRRLLKTERVTHLVQTIKDCLATAMSLQTESNIGLSELDFQSRLLQQLTVACNDLHSTFSLPIPEKMAVIASDREKKFRLSLKKRTPLPLSEATRRTLQRKSLVNSAPPAQRVHDRKRSKSASSMASETNSCRSTPGSRRPLASTILSQKFSVSVGGRRPWR